MKEDHMRKLALPTVVKLALLSVVFCAATAIPVAADHPSGATPADIRQLQTEMELLDESLRLVDADHPRAREFQRREDELRESLTCMRVQARRHQRDQRQTLGPSRAELEDLRRSAADLRNDIERSLGSRGRRVAHDIRLPDGTEIPLRLDQGISSRSARPEDRVEASVAQSVLHSGLVAIPAGTRVLGTVLRVEPAERPSRAGHLELSFDSLVMDDGRRADIHARVVSLGEEGLDKRKAGLGALIGGILGAVVDGKKGAVIGGILGGGGAVVASKGEDVELPAGTLLTLRLERPAMLVRR